MPGIALIIPHGSASAKNQLTGQSLEIYIVTATLFHFTRVVIIFMLQYSTVTLIIQFVLKRAATIAF